MKFFLAVRSDAQDAWYGLVLVDLDKQAMKDILQLKELYQMVKSKEPSLREMGFLDRVPTVFYEDAVVDEVFNEEEQEKFESDEYFVLSDKHSLDTIGEPARTELDTLEIGDEGIAFRAYPKHADFSISSVEVTYNQLLEWGLSDG